MRLILIKKIDTALLTQTCLNLNFHLHQYCGTFRLYRCMTSLVNHFTLTWVLTMHLPADLLLINLLVILYRKIQKKFSGNKPSLLFIAITSLFSSYASGSPPMPPLTISTYSSAVQEYQHFLQGRNVQDIDDYRMSNNITRRVILEMVLMQQAFQANLQQPLDTNQYQRPIHFRPGSDDYNRTLMLINDGKILTHSDSYWKKDLLSYRKTLYISEATIEYGQYIVGLYTSPNNHKALNNRGKNLHMLTAVSNKHWSADWEALSALPLKNLRHVRHWRLMANMVAKQDTDFFLIPFQGTENHAMIRKNLHFVPIPGIKIALYDSRHFAISKIHPDGAAIIKSLNNGIKIMKKQGRWYRAYRESGVIDDRVERWTTINLKRNYSAHIYSKR